MSVALKVLRRVEATLLSSPVPEIAIQVSDLILRLQGVSIEPPTPAAEILKLCQELDLDPALSVEAQRAQDILGGKALLIELVKRTAFDWVLYRDNRSMEKKKIAEEAYIWLFLENESHYHWQIREADGKAITSFISICDILDMDPDRIRSKIRTLTPQRVMSSGRPPGHMRNEVHDVNVSVHTSLPSEEPEEADIGSFF